MEQLSRLNHKDLILWRKALDPLRFWCISPPPRFRDPRPVAWFPNCTVQRHWSLPTSPKGARADPRRSSTKEFIDFLRVARGSMAELETQLLLAQRVGYLSESEVIDLQDRIDEVGRILHAVAAGPRRRRG